MSGQLTLGAPAMDSGADLSECRRYRYRLWRYWDMSKDEAVFVMLNPSTADASVDDPTIRKCCGFARRWGFGGIIVVNLFAFRSTDPKGLREVDDPVGPLNDMFVVDAVRAAPVAVAAWGNHGTYRGRDAAVMAFDARHLFDAVSGATLSARELETAIKRARRRHAVDVPGEIAMRDIVRIALRYRWIESADDGMWRVLL